jgi:hypothetical protein
VHVGVAVFGVDRRILIREAPQDTVPFADCQYQFWTGLTETTWTDLILR